MTEVRMRFLFVLLFAASLPIAMAFQAQAFQGNPSRPPDAQTNDTDAMKVTFLGTGGGPRPNPTRFGASILVHVGTEDLLFDCGRGVTLRLVQAGIPLRHVSKIFLTHLHSDHVIGIPDLLLTGWGTSGRAVPLRVWGPNGTRRMMEFMQKT